MSRFIAVTLVAGLLCGCMIAIGGGRDREVRTITERPSTGTLCLTVNATGAEVLLDGRLYGQVQAAGQPQKFAVMPGSYALAVKKAGYKPYETTIGVAAGGENNLTIELIPASQ